jgi:chromosome segregation ATPase
MMSDDTAPKLDELQRLTENIRFILDAKACAKRAEELIGLTIAANEAQAAAEQAQAGLATREAELDARERRLDAIRTQLGERSETIEARHSELRTVAAELHKLDGIIRWRVANHAGLLEGLDPTLLTRQISWEEIDERLNPSDAHFDEPAAMPAPVGRPAKLSHLKG